MKIRPLLMKPYNVRQILDGFKTETRRLDDRYNMHPGDVFRIKETFLTNQQRGKLVVEYQADHLDDLNYLKSMKWKSPLFMRQDQSRLYLEVLEKRNERLQDITEAGARAEGIREIEISGFPGFPRFVNDRLKIQNLCITEIESFKTMWDCIAKPGKKWGDNPKVFVFRFRIWRQR